MGKLIDLTGQRFGFWQVLSKADKNKSGQTQWLCQCDCGTQKNITTNSLRTYNSTSCGCNHNPDLVNAQFGDLKVIKLDEDKTKDKKRRYWTCQCTCQKSVSITTYELRKNYKCLHNSYQKEVSPRKLFEHKSMDIVLNIPLRKI